MSTQKERFGYKIAIFDPTTIWGKELQQTLVERSFPYESVKLIDVKEKIGTLTEFDGEAMVVAEADNDTLAELDILFVCGKSDEAKKLIAKYDDLSLYVFDLTNQSVELKDSKSFVAGVDDKKILDHEGIFAAPHSAVVPMSLLIKILDSEFKLKKLSSTIMTPVTEVGFDGISDLHQQTTDLLNFKSLDGKQRVFNLYPKPEKHQEEINRIKNEVTDITGINSDLFSFSLLDVPTFFGNLFSTYVELETVPGADYNWKKLFSKDESFRFDGDISEGKEPLGPVEIAETDKIHIQIISRDTDDNSRLWFWMLADNIRTSSVLNTVKVAEILLEL